MKLIQRLRPGGISQKTHPLDRGLSGRCGQRLRGPYHRACHVDLASLPDVPTTFELGLGNLEAAAWQGMAVPAATPDAVKRRLSDALLAGMTDLWNKDHQYWFKLIKSRGISAE